MLDWLRAIFDSSSLTKEENRHATEAKQRALNILHDALKKKDSLLVDDPEDFGDQKECKIFALISTDLVKELISQLQKVVFKRGEDLKTGTIAYVYPTEMGVIYLCPLFWKQQETWSQPMTLIHEVSHLLGYKHTIEENIEKVKTSQQYKLCPVSVWDIEMAFSLFMDHSSIYTNGSYSCCGETSRDTVCEKSAMSYKLRYVSNKTNYITEAFCYQR